jgi:hypothetical protein
MYTLLQPAIRLSQPEDIIYWSKKWEISPGQLLKAVKATKSNKVHAIAAYLREMGFAL